jgi:hypothetical protein
VSGGLSSRMTPITRILQLGVLAFSACSAHRGQYLVSGGGA